MKETRPKTAATVGFQFHRIQDQATLANATGLRIVVPLRGREGSFRETRHTPCLTLGDAYTAAHVCKYFPRLHVGRVRIMHVTYALYKGH